MPDLTPSDISRQTFVVTKKGFDAQQVRAYLEELASGVALLQSDLADARARTEQLEGEVSSIRAAEEALQMTLVTATKTKDEMLATAKEQAEELRHEAFQEAQRARTEAIREADDLLVRAREDSLRILEEAKRNAQLVISTAQADSRDLRESVAHLRESLSGTRATLVKTLEATLATVTEAEQSLGVPALESTGLDDIAVHDGEILLGDIAADAVELDDDDLGDVLDSWVDSNDEQTQEYDSRIEERDAELVDAGVVTNGSGGDGGVLSRDIEFDDLSDHAVPTADELLAQLRSMGD